MEYVRPVGVLVVGCPVRSVCQTKPPAAVEPQKKGWLLTKFFRTECGPATAAPEDADAFSSALI